MLLIYKLINQKIYQRECKYKIFFYNFSKQVTVYVSCAMLTGIIRSARCKHVGLSVAFVGNGRDFMETGHMIVSLHFKNALASRKFELVCEEILSFYK